MMCLADLEGIRTHQLNCRLSRKSCEREGELIDLNSQIRELLRGADPFDIVYERFALWSHSAMEFAAESGVPGILEVNSPLINEQKTYRTLINEAAAKNIRARCFRAASSLIAVSEQVAQQVRKNYFARFKTTTVPNGVNCNRFRAVAYDGKNTIENKIVIGFVGTLKPWHGVSKLIEAFAIVRAKNPDVVLRIVGDGPQRQRLRDFLQQYPDTVQKSVQWLDAIPNSLIPQVLSTFDIAVAPYPELPDFYFSPLKILEYMAAGLPIVASRIGQIPTLVDHESTGLLVKPGCPQSLSRVDFAFEF